MKTNTAAQLDLFEDQPTQVSNHNSMLAKIKGMHAKFGMNR